MVKFSYWNAHLLVWNGERVVEVVDLTVGAAVDATAFQRENNPTCCQPRSPETTLPIPAREMLDEVVLRDAASLFLSYIKLTMSTWPVGICEDVGGAMQVNRSRLVAKLDEWPALERRIRVCLNDIRKKLEL